MKIMHLFYIDILVFQEVIKRVILSACTKSTSKTINMANKRIKSTLQLQYEVFRPSDFDLTLI